MKRLEIALLIGLAVAIGIASFGAFGAQAEEVREEVLRLHVLANSDSEEDQALKLAVRDALLEDTRELFAGASGRVGAERAVLQNLAEIEEAARDAVTAGGFDYPVTVRLVNMYFETRVYDGVALPAGRYDAVRVEIGEARGKNWWCVMFPPMCIPAAAEQDATPLEEKIRELGEPPHYTPKLAVVELIESLQNRMGGGDREAVALLEEPEAE